MLIIIWKTQCSRCGSFNISSFSWHLKCNICGHVEPRKAEKPIVYSGFSKEEIKRI